jgi:O-antigen ligase
MGMVEPKGAISLIEAGGSYHVEGSLFQIAEEMGVWGLGLWLAFLGGALVRIYRGWHSLTEGVLRAFSGAALTGWAGSLVAFLFLPLMQSISLMVWLWFLLGTALAASKTEAAWSDPRLRAAELPQVDG